MAEVLEQRDHFDWNRLPAGYRRSCVPLDAGVYWHLFYKGDRVNGGLAEDPDQAKSESRRCAYAHHWSLEENHWSRETRRLLRTWDDWDD